jgi:hypothetical protein
VTVVKRYLCRVYDRLQYLRKVWWIFMPEGNGAVRTGTACMSAAARK